MHPEAQMQLTRANRSIPAVVPLGARDTPRVVGDPALDRALDSSLRLPVGSGVRSAVALTQVSIGRFDAAHVGVGNELAVTLGDGSFLAKGTFARLGPSYAISTDGSHSEARVSGTPGGTSPSADCGQFLDGDRVVATDMSRFFGNTETGLFFRHSARGSLAGIGSPSP